MLTYRQNGRTVTVGGTPQTNLVQASWWNDFADLLTGVMTDQPITLKNNLTLKQIGTVPASSATIAIAAAGALDVGAHTYSITFVSANGGETVDSAIGSVMATSGNQTASISAIQTGPTGTVSRKLYRSKVGTVTPKYYLATLNDNTTTTYTDAAADSTLGANPPARSTFGGWLQWQDASGNYLGGFGSDASWLGNLVLVGGIATHGVNTVTQAKPGSGATDYLQLIQTAAIGGKTTALGLDYQGTFYINDNSNGTILAGTGAGLTQIASQPSVALGVPVIVALAQDVPVNSTAAVTPISYTPTFSGVYRVSVLLRINNGTSNNLLSCQVNYTDSRDSQAHSFYNFVDGPATAGTAFTALNGSASIPNNVYICYPITFEAKAGSAISVTYRDPTNTPNDLVTVVVERLT